MSGKGKKAARGRGNARGASGRGRAASSAAVGRRGGRASASAALNAGYALRPRPENDERKQPVDPASRPRRVVSHADAQDGAAQAVAAVQASGQDRIRLRVVREPDQQHDPQVEQLEVEPPA